MPIDVYFPDDGESFCFEVYLDEQRATVIGVVRGCDTRLGRRDETGMVEHYLELMRAAAFRAITDQTKIRHLLDCESSNGRRVMLHARDETIISRQRPADSLAKGARSSPRQ